MRWILYALLICVVGFTPAHAAGMPVDARVEGNIVFHPSEPGFDVRVPETAVYVGSDRFVLYDMSDCEMHIFVEADADRKVRRLYWVQFENYLPSRPQGRFDYGEKDPRMEIWGGPIWVRAIAASTARPVRAGSDTERYRAILQRAGYILPARIMSVRMVRLLDDPKGTGYGRRELMLIYLEDMEPSGLVPDELMIDGKPTQSWAAVEKPLIDRARNAFLISPR